MPENRVAHYAGFAIYPTLIAVMILVIGGNASLVDWATALLLALVAASLWALMDRLLLRVLQLQAPVSGTNWQFQRNDIRMGSLTGEGR